MALFDQSLVRDICQRVMQRQAALNAMLRASTAPADQGPPELTAPLVQSVQLLISIANGECSRGDATKAEVAQAEAALAQVQAALFGNAMQTRAIIPDEFWQTDVGILLSRARWWISADELITVSNAAALAFGANTQANRMRIARAMNSSQLDWIPDPSVANPQQNRRVLRPQVERLGQQRRRPE